MRNSDRPVFTGDSDRGRSGGTGSPPVGPLNGRQVDQGGPSTIRTPEAGDAAADLTDHVFGDLVVVCLQGRAPDGERFWLCRCACGREIVRGAYSLNASKTFGRRAACKRCGGKRITPARRGRNARRHFRKQWSLTGSLWAAGQEERLVASVRRDLEEAFGPSSPSYDGGRCAEPDGEEGTPCEPDAPATLQEVGAALGITRERVRQIEAVALEKLRRALMRLDSRLFPPRGLARP